jgi:hypothetical protein
MLFPPRFVDLSYYACCAIALADCIDAGLFNSLA